MPAESKKISLIVFLVACLFWFTAFCGSLSAYKMNSGNYHIEVDDNSIAGGDWASVNYIFRDTVGEVSTGSSESASYKIKAGYQEMHPAFISISAPENVDLLPPIPGITGGTGDGSATWTVLTENSAGFNMKIKASTTPAMKLDAGYYFDDYTSGSEGVPDYDWSVASNEAEFGFTVEPETDADAVQAFLDNASNACNQASGSQTTDKCWLDFNGTTDVDILNRTTRTSTSGEAEVVKFRANSEAKFLKEGNYQATITTTVASN